MSQHEHDNADSAITHTMAGIFAWLGTLQGEDILICVSVIVMAGRGIYDVVRFIHYMKDRADEKRKQK